MKNQLASFLTLAISGLVVLLAIHSPASAAEDLDRNKPIGEAKGIHPGRVVWVHDPAGRRLERPGRWPLVGGQPRQAGSRRRHDGAGRLRSDRRDRRSRPPGTSSSAI